MTTDPSDLHRRVRLGMNQAVAAILAPAVTISRCLEIALKPVKTEMGMACPLGPVEAADVLVLRDALRAKIETFDAAVKRAAELACDVQAATAQTIAKLPAELKAATEQALDHGARMVGAREQMAQQQAGPRIIVPSAAERARRV